MGSVYLRGDSWVVKYKDENGNWKRKTLGQAPAMTKTMAREILKTKERQIKLGEYDMLETVIPTLMCFSKDYLTYIKDTVKKRSWKRDELCLKHLNRFFGEKKLSNIKPQDIDDYKASRLKDVAPATVDRELEVLRHLFNLAERWNKFFGKNPVSKSGLLHPINQKERILSLDEEKRLLSVCDTYLHSIIVTALYTGMRKGEILSLKWENIDLANNLITIDQTNAKSKKTRRIPVNSVIRKLLLEQRLKSAGSEYVFLSSKGTPYMRQDSLNRAYLLSLAKAEIKGLRFHDLRHTAATRLIELGYSIVAVKEILGHASINTTMRYVHPNESLRTALEGLTTYFSDSLGHKSGHINNKQRSDDNVTY